MAGSFIQVEVKGQATIAKALNKLLRQGSDLSPALVEIGDYLVDSTQERFNDQQAPDGTPWEELSPLTLSRKKSGLKILGGETGSLRDNINYQLQGGNTLLVGSNEEYAAMHQFGGITSSRSMFPNQEIPARPFLGVAPFEHKEILTILQNHLQE